MPFAMRTSKGSGTMTDKEEIVGKVVESMTLDPDGEVLRINFADKTAAEFESEGDCCSYTWIEHVSGVKQLLGQQVTKVEDIPLNDDLDDRDGELSFYGMR